MPPTTPVERLLVGVCNGSAKGGHLGKKVDEVVERAGENTPVLVRSTKFPSNPNTTISQKLGKLITDGGRRVVVEDSDWRAMAAMRKFRQEQESNPAFGDWLKQSRPLSNRKSLRTILDLDHLRAVCSNPTRRRREKPVLAGEAGFQRRGERFPGTRRPRVDHAATLAKPVRCSSARAATAPPLPSR